MRARTRLVPLLFRLAVYAAAVFVVLNAPSLRPHAEHLSRPAAEAARVPAAERAAPGPPPPAPSPPSPAPSTARLLLLTVLAAGVAVELRARRPVWR